MDFLFQRYANPFPLLNGMIGTGRLCEFIDEFVKIRNEEEEYKITWEFWLHKVFDKSYAEWKEDLNPTEKNEAAPTQAEMEETIRASFEMLEGFSLRGGAQDGTISDTGYNSD